MSGCTPADLQDMGMSHLFNLPSPGAGESLTLTPAEIANRNSPIVNRRTRQPRSKASRLPNDIRLSLNALLLEGRSYIEIIRWLSGCGFPGFNKVNVHNWRTTGFQRWLSDRRPEAAK